MQCKRSATDAQLPTSIAHQHKRPMYAQSLPGSSNTQAIYVEDAPEEHSLINRWLILIGDTFRAVKSNITSQSVPAELEAEEPEVILPQNICRSSTSEQERPTPTSRSRLPLPRFDVQSTNESDLSNKHVFLPVPPSLTSSGSTRTSESISTTSPTTETPTRLRYPKHNHVHLAQHKQRVQEHNKMEMERLKTRRFRQLISLNSRMSSSLSFEAEYDEEWDMERTLMNARKIFVEEANDKLFKEWETQKHLGSYKSDFDSFTGLHIYRQLILDQKEKIDIPVSPSLPDLSTSISKSRVALPRRGSFNLERALQIAHQTLNEPRPRFPTWEKLRITARQKDKEINKRIRQATRLPTHLPLQAAEEVRLLREKRGIIAKIAKEQVADSDLFRLNPKGSSLWLNDEIINFYGALLTQRAERYIANKENRVHGLSRKGKEPEYLNIHYFNTFFWPKVERSYQESRLSKWTKKLDIFSKDIILIPVNHQNVHWSLAAINLRKKRIESYDSLGNYNTSIYKKLRLYLQEEHQDKKKKSFDFTGWEDYYDENTPQQENGYDCGVFTCQFMESLSRGADFFAFDQSDMTYIRDRMTWELGRSQLWGEPDT